MGLLQTKGEQASSDQISGHYCCCPRYPLSVGEWHVFEFSLIFGLDFKRTYLGFQIQRRGEGGERILRPKDCVIKSWQLETVVLLRYFEGNRINQDHNAF